MSNFFLSFLLSLALCLSLQAHLPVVEGTSSPTGPNLIDRACQGSPDKNFCINLLKSDRTSPKADLKGLAFIALKFVEKEATNTSFFLKIALDNPEMDMEPGVENALTDCNDHYLNSIDLIEDSINALVSDIPSDLTKFMNAVVADLDGCDASVTGQGSVAAEVAAKNKYLHQLINMALSVVKVSQSAH